VGLDGDEERVVGELVGLEVLDGIVMAPVACVGDVMGGRDVVWVWKEDGRCSNFVGERMGRGMRELGVEVEVDGGSMVAAADWVGAVFGNVLLALEATLPSISETWLAIREVIELWRQEYLT
jgi:hypothetical protein